MASHSPANYSSKQKPSAGGWGAPWSWRLPLGGMVVVAVLGVFDVIPVQPVYTDLGLILTVTGVWLILEIAKRHLVVWAALPSVMSVGLDMAGDYLHWYVQFSWYDAMLHAVGGAAAAIGLGSIINHRFGKTVPAKFRYWLIFTGVVAASVFYELEEYLEDYFTGSNRLGDGFDTANDLLMNSGGAALAVGLIIIVSKRFKAKVAKA